MNRWSDSDIEVIILVFARGDFIKVYLQVVLKK